MNNKSKVRKSNNKGLTLIEVIVAVAVLSIAILPLLYSFVYTAKFNMKSREKQRATSAAQAIVEKYKAYSIDDINDGFTNGTFDVGKQGISTTSTQFNMVAGATEIKYVMKGVNFESAATDDKSSYDALITVNRHDPSDTKYTGAFFEIDGNDRNCDAVYRVNEDLDSANYQAAVSAVKGAWQALTDKGPGEPSEFTKLDVIRFKRNLVLTISKSGSVYKISPSLSYTYAAQDTYRDASGASKVFRVNPTTLNIDLSSVFSDGLLYDNTNTVGSGATLKRFYIYYFPIYSTTGTELELKDNIEVLNYTGETIDVYLYKQKPVTMTDAAITTAENQLFNKTRTNVKFVSSPVNLYQNLDTNIGNGYSNGLGATLDSLFTGPYNLMQMNSTSPTPVPTAEGSLSLPVEGAMATATPGLIKSDILSDIQVQIYRSGGVNLDGTVAKPEALLTEIQGSFNGKE